MKVCIYGCGYFGLTIACGFSLVGHDVYCIDKNDYRVSNLKKGIIDTFEPYLKTAMIKKTKEGDLRFYDTPNIEPDTDIFIVAIGTKEHLDGSHDIENIKSILKEINAYITNDCLIMIKSTMSIRDVQKIRNELVFKQNVELVYSPEFISQGSALEDFLTSSKVVVTKCSENALCKIKILYQSICDDIIMVDDRTAEFAKLANDAFLAVKLSCMNEITNLSSKVGADIKIVKEILGKDKRIGSSYINEGIGYGGASLHKNINLLLNAAKEHKNELSIIKTAKIVNENQKRLFISSILKYYNYNIEGKVFSIWGLSFKENTSDTRESASNTVIDALIRYGAIIRAYDPKAVNNTVKQMKTKEETLMSSNALIILTPWKEFKNVDFDFVSKNLVDKVIFDARNLYLNVNLSQHGLKYIYIGKSDV